MKSDVKYDLLDADIDSKAAYDAESKKVFMHKSILAPILMYTVEEYAGYSPEEIEDFIDADIRQDVNVSDLDDRVEARSGENTSPREKLSTFDLKFKAKNPLLSSDDMIILLHFDMEFQRDGMPGYPLIKRGIYYAARDLSRQLGNVTEETDYAVLSKVYSIWIIHENIPKESKNSISRYHFTKEDLAGKSENDKIDYDLLEVVLIRRGEKAPEEKNLLDYLEGVFEADIERVNGYISADPDSDLEEEMKMMGGYSQIIEERAWNKGQKDGWDKGQKDGWDRGRASRDREKIEEMLRSGKTAQAIAEFCNYPIELVEEVEKGLLVTT